MMHTATLQEPRPGRCHSCIRACCLFFCALALFMAGCQRKATPKDAKDASAARRSITKAPARPRRPAPPPCKEGEITHFRCIPYCGATKILGFAKCTKGKPSCKEGVKEDRCD